MGLKCPSKSLVVWYNLHLMNHEVTSESSVSATRNSEFRRKISGVTQGFGEWFVDHFPWIPANAVTAASAAGVVGCAIWATKWQDEIRRDPKKAIPILIALGISAAGDVADGAVARAATKKNPEKANSMIGSNVDSAFDRLTTTALDLSHLVSAYNRKDKIGKIAAVAVTVTNPGPSLGRAIAEENGYTVPESGEGGLGKLGTHSARMGTRAIGAVAAEIGPIPVQVAVDIATTAANLVTTRQRLRVVFDSRIEAAGLSDKTRAEARVRRKVLTAAAGLSVVATGATLWQLHRK